MDKLWTSLAFLILSLSSSCSTPLRQDPSPAAADVGYPTAEFRAGGKLFHGLGEVLVERGAPLNHARLVVQGYHEGVIRVDSLDCGVNQAWQYVDSAALPVEITGTAVQSCLIDIIVSPSFGADADGTRVYEMKGQLLVKVLDAGQPWVGFSSKIRAGGDRRVGVPVEPPQPSAPVRLFFRGCGSSYDWTGQPVNGEIWVAAAELSGPVQEGRCAFEGAAQQGDYAKRVSWRVWGYRADFAPLPLPAVELRGRRLEVTADDTVSLLALDGDYVFDTSARFPFDASKTHTLRAFTVKGRSFVCDYVPGREGASQTQLPGGWRCLN